MENKQVPLTPDYRLQRHHRLYHYGPGSHDHDQPLCLLFLLVFSPFFNFLSQHAATQWLTKFFLPHMILPPTHFLRAVRILGSICFVVGLVTFCFCAAQVYLGKIFHWGIAARGLYRYIRHPQDLALGLWGIGMAILWPRFIVLATLALMFVLYYFSPAMKNAACSTSMAIPTGAIWTPPARFCLFGCKSLLPVSWNVWCRDRPGDMSCHPS